MHSKGQSHPSSAVKAIYRKKCDFIISFYNIMYICFNSCVLLLNCFVILLIRLQVKDQTILDREKRSTINMRVYAKEKSPSVVTEKVGSSSVNIEVTLLDANDNNPTFIPNNLYDFIISTELKVGDVVGQIHAIDPDEGLNGLVHYSLQRAANNSAMFTVDSKTGQILVNTPELTLGKHLLFVEASDQPKNPSERRFSLAVVSIEVKNVIDRGNVCFTEICRLSFCFRTNKIQ